MRKKPWHEIKMFPNFAGNMENHLLWSKILYDCIQNLVRLRIYKTLTRTREVKLARSTFCLALIFQACGNNSTQESTTCLLETLQQLNTQKASTSLQTWRLGTKAFGITKKHNRFPSHPNFPPRHLNPKPDPRPQTQHNFHAQKMAREVHGCPGPSSFPGCFLRPTPTLSARPEPFPALPLKVTKLRRATANSLQRSM